MDVILITDLNNNFEKARHEKDGVEFWYARELQKLLGYTQWRNFVAVIDKAKTACHHSGVPIEHHFADVSNLVESVVAPRFAEDMKLTRYACYLIAQNGDPRKEVIAFAQSYFALQTRKQELLEERIKLMERLSAREKLSVNEKELSRNIYQRGVDERGFSRIRSKGDSALFGGNNTQEMKEKLNVPSTRPLADFLPTVTIKAKDFAVELTNFNVKKGGMRGEVSITKEHVKNNKAVRQTMVARGVIPEELPSEEDIKKLERRIKLSGKALTKHKNLKTSKQKDSK